MTNDSVREELIAKITPLVKTVAKPIPKTEQLDLRGDSPVQNKMNPTLLVAQQNIEISSKIERKIEVQPENHETSELDIKNTSPTLVEFHNKNAKIPEWRLQLKNAVRQRNNRISDVPTNAAEQKNIEIADSPNLRRRNLRTNGATALKTEKVAETVVETAGNPKLEAALKRIDKARQQFLENEKQQQNPEDKAKSNTLLYFTAKPNDHLPKTAFSNSTNFEQKTKIANSMRKDGDKFDTNKLPPLPKPAKISSSFNHRPVVSEVIETNFVQKQFEKQELVEQEIVEIPEIIEEIENIEIEEAEIEEIDDCAPFAMRFNAGLFDLIIGSFVSLLLLTPFMAMGGEWFTLAGFFAFLVTTSIVMFIYMTTAIGIYGRTFGMKLFSLEVVDIEGEEYPTLHQAAVSSSVYLVSLALGGIGFLTLLFNDEKRAAHDLASRTIVVKEF